MYKRQGLEWRLARPWRRLLGASQLGLASWALVHLHPRHQLVFHVRLGQTQARTLEKWASAHSFPWQRHPWPFASPQSIQKALVGPPERMGLYPVGMRFSPGLGGSRPSPGDVCVGWRFPLFSLLAFWSEPFLLGLGDVFPSGYLLLRLENGYLSVKLMGFVELSIG